MKDWSSPVYAFFDPKPQISIVDGRCVHGFKCSAWGCKVTVRRFLDTKDARSTGNMRKHVKSCWGAEALAIADEAKDAYEVRTTMISRYLRNGSITAAFQRKGNGKITYSNQQHTRQETRSVVKFHSKR